MLAVCGHRVRVRRGMPVSPSRFAIRIAQLLSSGLFTTLAQVRCRTTKDVRSDSGRACAGMDLGTLRSVHREQAAFVHSRPCTSFGPSLFSPTPPGVLRRLPLPGAARRLPLATPPGALRHLPLPSALRRSPSPPSSAQLLSSGLLTTLAQAQDRKTKVVRGGCSGARERRQTRGDGKRKRRKESGHRRRRARSTRPCGGAPAAAPAPPQRHAPRQGQVVPRDLPANSQRSHV